MDIHEISLVVQQHFLQKGTYLPTIFVELDGADIEVLVLPQLHEKRYRFAKLARILCDAGRTFGQKTETTQLDVTGLCMAYLTVAHAILKEGMLAVKAGMLVVKMSEDNRLNCVARFYEVQKDRSERGVRLLENPFLSGEGMVSPLLPAFLLGIDTVLSQQSIDEARRRLSALLREYEQMIRGRGYYERFPSISVPD
jgi:hypothetical protein